MKFNYFHSKQTRFGIRTVTRALSSGITRVSPKISLSLGKKLLLNPFGKRHYEFQRLQPDQTHHLETSEPDKFKKSFKLIQDYKKLFKNTSYDPNDYILDASIVLSAYGIREARDLDYLTANKDDDLSRKISNNQELIENHAEFSQYYNCAIEDLIYNPANYFVFSDMKFVSLENLYQYKIKRAEKKDLIDARLIKMYRSNEKRSLQYHILKFKNDFNRLMQIARIESIITLMNILKKIGLYNILRKIYRFLIK